MRAVITGAGSGLGRALCHEVHRRGGSVVAADVDRDAAERTAAAIRAAGGRALAFRCDVTDPEQVEQLARFAEDALGGVDLLCNNAGVAVNGPFEAIDEEHWRWIVGCNLWGVVHGCRAFLPGMRARGSGAVLNVASAAGLLSAPSMAPYNVTKAGVVALSETLFAEYRPHGVGVTVLCPTFFETAILENARGPGTGNTERARAWMRRSKIQAPDVARIALDDVAAGRLYSLPMRDGRLLWRLKRLAPPAFHRLLARVARQR